MSVEYRFEAMFLKQRNQVVKIGNSLFCFSYLIAGAGLVAISYPMAKSFLSFEGKIASLFNVGGICEIPPSI